MLCYIILSHYIISLYCITLPYHTILHYIMISGRRGRAEQGRGGAERQRPRGTERGREGQGGRNKVSVGEPAEGSFARTQIDRTKTTIA